MSDLSGRFVLRVPPDLHRRLRERARGQGVSLNALCVRLLDEGLAPGTSAGVRGAPGLDPGLLEAVGREWADELVGIALFGSAARGDATDGSDIDVLLVLEPGAQIERSLYDRWDSIVRSRQRPEDRGVSPQFVSLPASPDAAGGIWLEVAREGIVVGDRDSRLARFLIALRDLVAEGAVIRKMAHGHPYWVRGGRGR